jgi:hypothetical protein
MCVVWSSPLLARGLANVSAGQAAIATATDYFAAFNDANQEIYFACTPSKMLRQIEILPSNWAETLPLFSVIEVRKRSRRDSSTRAVREQAAPPPVRWTAVEIIVSCIMTLCGVYLYNLISSSAFQLLFWLSGFQHDFYLGIPIAIMAFWVSRMIELR